MILYHAILPLSRPVLLSRCSQLINGFVLLLCSLSLYAAADDVQLQDATGNLNTLSIQFVGEGLGSILSTPTGINCTTDCSKAFSRGTQVSLSLSIEAGFKFKGWSGGCGGDTPLTNVVMNTDINCIATLGLSHPFIETRAGNGQGAFADNSDALLAAFKSPSAMAIDTNNTLYIADAKNNRIRVLSASGVVSTLAGTGIAGFSGDGGAATAAELNFPSGIAVGSDGIVYISDTSNHRIRWIDNDGVIRTLAGSNAGFAGDGGSVTQAQFDRPQGLAIDGAGNLYIADFNNHRVRSIAAGSGLVSTFAGNGTAGFSGDGSAATAAALQNPTDIHFDKTGNATIADYANHRVRRVTAGIISTVAGNGTGGFSGDQGEATAAQLNFPISIALDSQQDLYISDSVNHRLRKVDANGIIASLAGTDLGLGYTGDGSSAVIARLNQPWGLVIDSSDRLWLADSNNHVIRRLESSAGKLHQLNNNQIIVSMAVILAGTGSGTVTAAVGLGQGIDCGLICNENYVENTQITLTATPDNGDTFAGWSDDCQSAGRVLSLILDKNTHCVATFVTATTPTDGNTDIPDTDVPVVSGIQLTTVVGQGIIGAGSNNIQAIQTRLSDGVYGLAFDNNGSLFIADGGVEVIVNRIRRKGFNGIIQAFAGNGAVGIGGDGKAATAAPLSVFNVATDKLGNVYIADGVASTIRKISLDGIIQTIAGTGSAGYTGDGSLASTATLSKPVAIVIDDNDNIFIADADNHVVRKINPQGIISTFAGTGIAGFSGDGGFATEAEFNNPWSLALDSVGNLYIGDAANYRLRKITLDGKISSIAGTGEKAYSGDNSAAPLAAIGWPEDIVIDSEDTLYLADLDHHVVRAISRGGIIRTVAGTGEAGFSNGEATLSKLNIPSALTLDPADNLYIGENGNGSVRQLAIGSRYLMHITINGAGDGQVTAIAGVLNGLKCGQGKQDCLEAYEKDSIVSLTVHSAIGSEFLGWGSDCGGNRQQLLVNLNKDTQCIASFAPTGLKVGEGAARVILGTGISGFSGDGGSGTDAQLRFPLSLAVHPDGRLWVSDSLNNRIRLLDNGIVSSFAGSGSFGFSGDLGAASLAQLASPQGINLDANGRLYIADASNHRIRFINAAAVINTLTGTGNVGFAGDNGAANQAILSSPQEVVIDGNGNILIADSNNHRIRRIDGSGRISSIAGTGFAGFSGDNGFGPLAQLNFPAGLAVSPTGDIYIADASNHRIRKLDSNGIISTVAGNGNAGFSGDGQLATAASLNNPHAVALDNEGALYIADFSNHRIRKVDNSGIISTILGLSTASNAIGDGAPSQVGLNSPSDVWVTDAGDLYVADYANHRIIKVDADSPDLRIFKSGVGDGVVTADVGLGDGIQCGNNCTEAYLTDSVVVLSVVNDASSIFVSWSGDCVALDSNPLQAQVSLDQDRSCSANFIADPAAGLPACPSSGNITASCNAKNQNLSNITISQGVQIYNGSLGGTIVNQGNLNNVSLAANAIITGGSLVGNIQGISNAPATLSNISVGANSVLSHLVIGTNVQAAYGVTFAEGVLFTAASSIPQIGMELSPLLNTVTDNCSPVSRRLGLNLNNPIYQNGINLLDSFNAISPLAEVGIRLQQDSAEGYLLVRTADSISAINPVAVFHAPLFDNTLRIDDLENVSFFSQDALGLITQPAAQHLCELYASAVALDLTDFSVTNAGNIRIGFGTEYWLMRPSLTAPVTTLAAGVQILPSLTAADNTAILGIGFVFFDNGGQRYLQRYLPTPAHFVDLAQAVDINSLKINGDNLSFSLDGTAYQGILDYVVSPAVDTVADIFKVEPLPNADAVLLVYPNGDRQQLLLSPLE